MTNTTAIQMLATASGVMAEVATEAESRFRVGMLGESEFHELVEQIERGRECCYLAVKCIRKLDSGNRKAG